MPAAAVDAFSPNTAPPSWNQPVTKKATVTLDVDLLVPVRLVYCTTAGDISFKLPDGSTVVRTLAVKDTLDVYVVSRVNTSGTTGAFEYFY